MFRLFKKSLLTSIPITIVLLVIIRMLEAVRLSLPLSAAFIPLSFGGWMFAIYMAVIVTIFTMMVKYYSQLKANENTTAVY